MYGAASHFMNMKWLKMIWVGTGSSGQMEGSHSKPIASTITELPASCPRQSIHGVISSLMDSYLIYSIEG